MLYIFEELITKVYRFKKWGGSDPYRTAEDLAYATARFFQVGGTFNNYYMVL